MRIPKAAVVSAAVALLAVLGLSACGSSATPAAGPTATTTPAPTTTGPSATPSADLAAARARYVSLKAPVEAAFASARKLGPNATPTQIRDAEADIAKKSYALGQGVYATTWPPQAKAAAGKFLTDLAAAVEAERAAALAKTTKQLTTLGQAAVKAQTTASDSDAAFRMALGFTQ